MHVSKSTFSTLNFPFLLYCIKNKKIKAIDILTAQIIDITINNKLK